MKRRTVAVIASWSLLALTAPTAAAEPGDLVTFISPTGNVGCILDADYARCDIIDRDWNPPPRPVDCELDYGQGIGIAPGERPAFVCAGDTTLGGEKVLAYGDSLTRGQLSCDSSENGISCRDARTGHGFSLARQVYQLF
ncbi:DUF6636 domain-containing protein [Mycolicibacterium fluoranthenivorans]|uniref:DUF6636 domain-containing protein n=1 Tax=Mycolicibacterium fluoranthenivorans TaxID=258505 RepID=UPI001F2CDD75|nr:DUF6636 domain-containing protein [Mycolicibacterium fluoranthenivorans]